MDHYRCAGSECLEWLWFWFRWRCGAARWITSGWVNGALLACQKVALIVLNQHLASVTKHGVWRIALGDDHLVRWEGLEALAAVVASFGVSTIPSGWLPFWCGGVIGVGLCLGAEVIEYGVVQPVDL